MSFDPPRFDYVGKEERRAVGNRRRASVKSSPGHGKQQQHGLQQAKEETETSDKNGGMHRVSNVLSPERSLLRHVLRRIRSLG